MFNHWPVWREKRAVFVAGANPAEARGRSQRTKTEALCPLNHFAKLRVERLSILHDVKGHLDRVLASAGRAAFKAGAAHNLGTVFSLNSLQRDKGLTKKALDDSGLNRSTNLGSVRGSTRATL
jgi:hypothetical protein